MGLVEIILGHSERKKNTDFAKIKVTANGGFYMKSEDIFDNKDESLKLIESLRKSVKKYKVKQVAATNKGQIRKEHNA
ncbi:hypothetical protein [Flagellimonas crocea]|uniref:hypothetical protein n=1 Tax=Flagellimonas crocea TaxID=3067311 RepID=UPI00296E95B9|nr:hypothetical protein [Muricauda sp. DH64]